MTQNNTLNVTFSNSQLEKLKSGIKSGTEISLLFVRKSIRSKGTIRAGESIIRSGQDF